MEDIVTQWLRDNDPYYTSRDSNKRAKEDYPYLTERRQRRVKEKEIPISQIHPMHLEDSFSEEDLSLFE